MPDERDAGRVPGLMTARDYTQLVAREICDALSQTDEQQVETLLDMIEAANNIFVGGAGRSLMMMKAFAMRLMHIGLNAYVVGETITPAVIEGDLLIAGSGSGQTKMTLALVEAAAARGARTAVITGHPDSPLGQTAHHCLHLHAPVVFVNSARPTRQPPGTLFEQSLLAQCDAMILMLMHRRGTTEEHIRRRHTKFE
ncbi:MAG: SIS domain-containing protein [candidate division WS1 bacterium]|jgi:6-phospho-3-hexuloisomerase|nr:SIS domain-containing protein [candidate division WS1 bacterium]